MHAASENHRQTIRAMRERERKESQLLTIIFYLLCICTVFEWICWRGWFSWATTVYKFMIRFMFAFRFVFQFLLLREKMFIEIIRNRNTHRMSHRHHHQSFQWWRVHVCVYVWWLSARRGHIRHIDIVSRFAYAFNFHITRWISLA